MTFESVKCALSCPGGSTAAASKEKYFEGSLARWGGRGGGGGGGHLPPPTQPWAGVDSRQSQGRGCMMTVVVTISSSGVASITVSHQGQHYWTQLFCVLTGGLTDG